MTLSSGSEHPIGESTEIDVIALGQHAGQEIAGLLEGEEWNAFVTYARDAGSKHSPAEIKEELAYLALHAFSAAMILADEVSDHEEFSARRVAFAVLQQSGSAAVAIARSDEAWNRFNVNGQIIDEPKETDDSRLASTFGLASLVHLVQSRDPQHLGSGPRLVLWNMLAGFWLRTHGWWREHMSELAQSPAHGKDGGDLLARYVISNVVLGQPGEQIVHAAKSCRLNADPPLIFLETTMLSLLGVATGFAAQTGDLPRAMDMVRTALERLTASSTWRTWVTDQFGSDDLWTMFQVRLQQYGAAMKQMEKSIESGDSGSAASVAYSWAAGTILIHHLSRFSNQEIDVGDPTPEVQALLNQAAGCFYAGFNNGINLDGRDP